MHMPCWVHAKPVHAADCNDAPTTIVATHALLVWSSPLQVVQKLCWSALSLLVVTFYGSKVKP